MYPYDILVLIGGGLALYFWKTPYFAAIAVWIAIVVGLLLVWSVMASATIWGALLIWTFIFFMGRKNPDDFWGKLLRLLWFRIKRTTTRGSELRDAAHSLVEGHIGYREEYTPEMLSVVRDMHAEHTSRKQKLILLYYWELLRLRIEDYRLSKKYSYAEYRKDHHPKIVARQEHIKTQLKAVRSVTLPPKNGPDV